MNTHDSGQLAQHILNALDASVSEERSNPLDTALASLDTFPDIPVLLTVAKRFSGGKRYTSRRAAVQAITDYALGLFDVCQGGAG